MYGVDRYELVIKGFKNNRASSRTPYRYTIMSVQGPNYISVFNPGSFPPLFATDNGIDKQITVKEANPNHDGQIVRIVALLIVL